MNKKLYIHTYNCQYYNGQILLCKIFNVTIIQREATSEMLKNKYYYKNIMLY